MAKRMWIFLLGLLGLVFLSGGATADSSQPPELIDVIDVGAGPMGAAVNPHDDRIYVAQYHDDAVSVIDSVTHEIVTTIAVADGPMSVAVNINTNRIYVANGSMPTALSVIDGSTYTVIDTIPLGLGSLAGIGLAVNSETDRVYATSPLDNVVAVVDGTAGAVIDTVAVGQFPVGVGVNEVTDRVYATNMTDDSISVIDGVTNSVVSTIALNSGLMPSAVAVNPLTNRIYVANLASYGYEQGSVSVVDGDSEEVIAVLPMDTHEPSGGFVQGMALDAGANRIYVIDGPYDPGVLKVIDGETSGVVSAIELDAGPEGVAVNPQVNRAYVMHRSNPGVPGKVSVLGLEGDGDYDGFADGEEVFVGTDAVDDCPDNVDDDAWPADMASAEGYGKHDGTVNVLDVVQLTPPYFNTTTSDPDYSERKDFDASGSINILDIVRVTPPVFNTSCTP